MAIKFTNNASASLASAITASAVTISLASGQGALFPAISGSDYFLATLVDSSNNIEIVKVTARTSDTLTVVRGQDSTTARAFNAGDKLENRVTAAGLNAKFDTDGSTAMTGALNHGGFKATNVADPTAAQDAATKNYVDTTAVAAVNAEATTRAAAVTSEAAARTSADTTLQNNINAEATARANANAGKVNLDGGNATGVWGGTIPWSRVSSQPTALSQFSNNIGAVVSATVVANSYPLVANCGNINSLTIYKDSGTSVRLGYAAYNCNCNCCCCC